MLSKNKYKLFILPDINKHKYKYSLILSLNEILIYFDKSICNYMIRPGLFEFLKEHHTKLNVEANTTDSILFRIKEIF